jgi:hypothetical protein
VNREPEKPPGLLQVLIAADIGWMVYGLFHDGIPILELLMIGFGLGALCMMWLRDSWRPMVIAYLLAASGQSMFDFQSESFLKTLWNASLVVWPLFYIPALIREGLREWRVSR